MNHLLGHIKHNSKDFLKEKENMKSIKLIRITDRNQPISYILYVDKL